MPDPRVVVRATLGLSRGIPSPLFARGEPSREYHCPCLWAGSGRSMMADAVNLDQVSHELTQALEELARLAWTGVAGCDGASISVLQRGSVSTLVATQTRISDIDQAQYRNRDGPCVAAMRVRQPVAVVDYRRDDRWPSVAAEALQRGVRSSLSLPLMDGVGHAVGGLNMYGDASAGFGEASRRSADIFARHATLI